MLVLRLTLDLLDRPTAADPEPILLSIRTWNPAPSLDMWIAERLAGDNRVVARSVCAANSATRSLSTELVAAGRILPILDGLDEVAEHTVPPL